MDADVNLLAWMTDISVTLSRLLSIHQTFVYKALIFCRSPIA